MKSLLVLLLIRQEGLWLNKELKMLGLQPQWLIKKDDALIVKMLKERNIDFIVLAGYLAILTDAVN